LVLIDYARDVAFHVVLRVFFEAFPFSLHQDIEDFLFRFHMLHPLLLHFSTPIHHMLQVLEALLCFAIFELQMAYFFQGPCPFLLHRLNILTRLTGPLLHLPPQHLLVLSRLRQTLPYLIERASELEL